MKERLKKLISWKTLGKVLVGGLAATAGLILISQIAAIGAISTAFAIGLSTVVTIGAIATLGVSGLAAATGLVKGIVNGLRYAFSKKYRAQVKAARQERKNNKNKTNEEELEQEQEQEQKEEREIVRENNPATIIDNKGNETPVEIEVTESTELTEEDKEKALLNRITSKKFENMFSTLTQEEIRELQGVMAAYAEEAKNAGEDLKSAEYERVARILDKFPASKLVGRDSAQPAEEYKKTVVANTKKKLDEIEQRFAADVEKGKVKKPTARK